MNTLLKYKSPIACFFFVLMLLYTTSCAAILSKKFKEVSVTSSVEGTKVYVNGKLEAEAPVALKLRAGYGKHYMIEGRKEGYHTKEDEVRSKLGVGWLLLDVFLIFPLGPIVDGATGRWMRLDKAAVALTLLKEEEGETKKANTTE